jgi:hypothetical protein
MRWTILASLALILAPFGAWIVAVQSVVFLCICILMFRGGSLPRALALATQAVPGRNWAGMIIAKSELSSIRHAPDHGTDSVRTVAASVVDIAPTILTHLRLPASGMNGRPLQMPAAGGGHG